MKGGTNFIAEDLVRPNAYGADELDSSNTVVGDEDLIG